MAVSELNSFAPDVLPGQFALSNGNHNVLGVMFQTASTNYSVIKAGDVVVFADGKSAVPLVKSAKEDPDAEKIGIVTVSQQRDTHKSGNMLEIAVGGTDVYMIASGDIARGDKVIDGAATGQVEASTDENYLGISLDEVEDGEIVRIRVRGL